MAPSIRFVSLGMVVLDELRLPDGSVLNDCPGGSGMWSTLGARIVTDPKQADEIGSFIMAGYEFPGEITDMIRGWGLTLEVDVSETRESTRGLLEYHDEAFGHKTFRYKTTPLQPVPSDLPANMLQSRSFHMLYRPEKIVLEVSSLLKLRENEGISQPPLLVWEPFPSLCIPENLDSHLEACGWVDIFSPNHLELLGLYGKSPSPFDKNTLEQCGELMLGAIPVGERGDRCRAIVVRAGEHGCLVVSNEDKFWLPPYHTGEDSKVVDATGGGNAFLGAFAIVLERSGDVRQAAVAGSVAASFAIEQIGLPKRSVVDSREHWNNEKASERFGYHEVSRVIV